MRFHLSLAINSLRRPSALRQLPIVCDRFIKPSRKPFSMSQQPQAPLTAYPTTEIAPQDATPGKGLDSKMKPAANWSQLEDQADCPYQFWDDEGTKPYLQEYKGTGLLKDKAALITGGDSGIGRSVAILFAREGADVSFVYLPEEEEDAQATKKEIEKAGRKANLMQLDLLKRENCQKAVEGHLKAFGKLSVLVNNSAQQEICEDLKDIDLDVVEKTFHLNIVGMFAMTKYSLPHMKRGSCIINTGSVAGYMGNPKLVDYSSTKGAISTFTRALAQQQAPNGIRVNSVAPGIIWTPLQPATKGNAAEDVDSIGVGAAPLQRPGMPVEVAGAYVFLASPLGSYTTGATFHVTGGIENQS